MIRELQPGIIVNDRLDLLDVPGGWDYRTPEQFMPANGSRPTESRCPGETCQTFSGSWGYHRDEPSWKSVRQLVVMLIETVSKGGNLLLNVGPTGAARSTAGLSSGSRHRTVDGRERPLDLRLHPGAGRVRQTGRDAPDLRSEAGRLYVHVLEWPLGVLALDGLAGRVEYAQLLHDASEVRYTEKGGETGFMPGSRPKEGENTLTLRLPVLKPDVEVPVVEIFLKKGR